jgi:hypothetical protein
MAEKVKNPFKKIDLEKKLKGVMLFEVVEYPNQTNALQEQQKMSILQ